MPACVQQCLNMDVAKKGTSVGQLPLRHSTVSHHMQWNPFKIQAQWHSPIFPCAQENTIASGPCWGISHPQQHTPRQPGMYHTIVGICLHNDVQGSVCWSTCACRRLWPRPLARCVRSPTSSGCSGRKAASGSNKPVLAWESRAAPLAH